MLGGRGVVEFAREPAELKEGITCSCERGRESTTLDTTVEPNVVNKLCFLEMDADRFAESRTGVFRELYCVAARGRKVTTGSSVVSFSGELVGVRLGLTGGEGLKVTGAGLPGA